ncbi:fumarylacetoacetate hydrolase family protein [Mariniblastus sp.]|jgi:2-keto-4-pentenoate hydratase/2-oxohepta-3-ene-1,7-dioic acid hydratase in catechol pathway|nr:fumarylacetoacetate hydrolase family protein [Mariniblastus sp.]MDA7885185.1 fumarylacetoacetate hydrolase family protein [bacterium]MDA7901833.1 fumarylacetoacetate hydrolase family protein [bacterium]MDA7902336.1 fumarylacetoacetate hydrolase family protein [Mariniblastus sp.]MDA7924948.1 fumarylacetoacetate hydrolase family protein [Mariniblastus sp.]
MKLTRIQNPTGSVTPGILISNNEILDCSEFGQDWNEDFFASDGLDRLAQWVQSNQDAATKHNVFEVQLAPAIARPSKIVCVGLNYAKHAAESGMEAPSEPVVFFKATSAWSGPNDNIVIPRNSKKTDWEVELAVVIGKKAKYVSEANALEHVAGYAVHNDYSERQWQLEMLGQWVKGKSADTFAPFGPFMATKDEIPDPNNLGLWLKLNDKKIQDSNTTDFIFNIQQVVSYLSQFMTLLPGDVISTGTPAGVGLGFDPPTYLKPGDVVELGIDGLGTQKQTAIQEL